MKNPRTRLAPPKRKEEIMQAALVCAERDGYMRMTREVIAAEAGVSPGIVSHYLGTMINLRRAVMRRAVSQRIAAIVAEGIAHRDEQAAKAPSALLQEARALLARG